MVRRTGISITFESSRYSIYRPLSPVIDRLVRTLKMKRQVSLSSIEWISWVLELQLLQKFHTSRTLQLYVRPQNDSPLSSAHEVILAMVWQIVGERVFNVNIEPPSTSSAETCYVNVYFSLTKDSVSPDLVFAETLENRKGRSQGLSILGNNMNRPSLI